MSLPPPPSPDVPPPQADRRDRAFFGHPAGLWTLFIVEMWERFSYYGMRALLILFMTTATISGGLGFDKSKAGVIYAIYTSMVYFAGLAGGWLADNVLGQRRTVFWGGVVIMLGHISLAFHGLPCFFAGLVLVVIGTGLLKPNISTIVGLLYGPKDVRRDSGFALYYMGINIGSLLGQTVCGYFAQHPWFKANVLQPMGVAESASWHWGFAAAAVGMALGLLFFVLQGRLMGDAGGLPNPPRDEADRRRRTRILIAGYGFIAGLILCGMLLYAFGVTFEPVTINLVFGGVLAAITLFSFAKIIFWSDSTAEERTRLLVVFFLFLASVLFWGAFEQAGSALNLFADKKSAVKILGFDFPSTWYQNINPFGILILSPVFAYLWLRWGRRAPSGPAKFALALVLLGGSFAVAAVGSAEFDRTGERLSPLWLTSVYITHSFAELLISPIGLSLVTQLAPQRSVSQVMAIWFLANADGNFLAGQTVVLGEKYGISDTQIFWIVAAVTGGAGVLLALLVRPIKRMMGGVH